MTLRQQPVRGVLHAAFSATAAAGLFLISGFIGYSLSHGFFEGTWTGHIVWWEIRLGIIWSLCAVYFWRKGLRALT